MGQAPVYKDVSLALFANGYLAIVAEESRAVKDIMPITFSSCLKTWRSMVGW